MVIEKGIAVIGSTTIDKIVKENGASMLKLGGATTYSGITYSRHGFHTIVVSNVAEKDLTIFDKLHNEQVHVCYRTTQNTTHFVNRIIGNSRKQELTKKACAIKCNQIRDVLDRVSCIHFSPLHPMDIDIEVIKRFNDQKYTVFLDVQGYTRLVRDQIVYRGVSTQLSDALRVSQVVKANEAELNSMLDYFKTNLTDLMLSFEIEEFLVTGGEKGGLVKNINGHEFKYTATSVKTFDDPTGVGDVFFACYIISRYLKKMAAIDACAYASKISAQQVEGRYILPNELFLSHTEPELS
jgi:sugar/nucleoside kinase (ribokinase family)